MLQQHADFRRRRHGRLPRSAARGGDRLRRHACRREKQDHRFRREAGAIRRRCRAIPTRRSPRWAFMSSRPISCSIISSATPRIRSRAAISARTSFPTSSSTAKRSRIISPIPACVRPTTKSAYWRDVGTVDAYWEANIDLTDIVPDLDLFDKEWPIWTDGSVTPPAKFVHDEDSRRGMAISSVVSGGCIISGAKVKRSLLSTGVRVNSYCDVENAVILPYVEIGRSTRLCNVVIDRGVKIPERPRRRRGSGHRRQAVPPHRKRHLPHHSEYDRPVWHDPQARQANMSKLTVLAVVSEIFPLVKTGGLADVAGALPAALAAEGVEVVTLVARLSRRDESDRARRNGDRAL